MFWLTNLLKTKYDFFPDQVAPITDVPTVNFLTTLGEINSKYNKALTLKLLITISLFSNSCSASTIPNDPPKLYERI